LVRGRLQGAELRRESVPKGAALRRSQRARVEWLDHLMQVLECDTAGWDRARRNRRPLPPIVGVALQAKIWRGGGSGMSTSGALGARIPRGRGQSVQRAFEVGEALIGRASAPNRPPIRDWMERVFCRSCEATIDGMGVWQAAWSPSIRRDLPSRVRHDRASWPSKPGALPSGVSSEFLLQTQTASGPAPRPGRRRSLG
jgi:hypothetical protein